jgi:hypothetical protein
MRRAQLARGLSAFVFGCCVGCCALACSGAPHGGGAAGVGGAAGSNATAGAAGTLGAAGTATPSGGTSGSAGTAGTTATPTGGTTAPTDASVPDAGQAGATADASVVDAGGTGPFGYTGASRCATSGALLCESFENGLDSAVWTPLIDGTGTATIDDVHAFRGTKALHINVTGTGHKAAISETKTFPVTGNVLYARMFLWFDTFTTTAHFTMAEAPQTAAGAWIRFGGQGGHFGVGTDHGASGDWLQQDTTPVPTKQWTCMELAFRGDTNEFHVWQDDVERTALNIGATKHAGFVMPPFTSLWFGWQTYSNQAPGEVWIDEIAIDDKPIGCTK